MPCKLSFLVRSVDLLLSDILGKLRNRSEILLAVIIRRLTVATVIVGGLGATLLANFLPTDTLEREEPRLMEGVE